MDPFTFELLKNIGILVTFFTAVVGAYFKVFKPWFEAYVAKQATDKEFKDKINKIVYQLHPNGGASLADKIQSLVTQSDKVYKRQVRIENKLEYSSQIHRSMMDVMNLAYWESDVNGICTNVSRGLSNMLGCSEDEIMGNGWIQLIDTKDQDKIIKSWKFSIDNKLKFDEIYSFIKIDKTKLKVRGMSFPIIDSKGELIGFFGTIKKYEG